MKKSTIYSIGYGNKDIDTFIGELQTFGIKYLLDIRTSPFSKWNPKFNQQILKFTLENNGIKYVFAGDTLGGLPMDRTCYNEEGKVVYGIVKTKSFFKEGLQRLITANEKNIKLAIMCTESKPEECHRSKLIGDELSKKNISLNHIIDKNTVKSQENIMSKLTGGCGQENIFGEEMELTSRKSH